MPRPVTVLEVAAFELSRPFTRAIDFSTTGLPLAGECETCHRTVTCYKAYPTRAGHLRCAEHIGTDGWTDVGLADHEMFVAPRG